MKRLSQKFFKVGFLPLLVAATLMRASSSVSGFVPEDKIQPASPLKIAALDFLLPGYGTYTQNKTGFAAAYFSANIVNLALIYVAYRNWRFYESAYAAAAVRQSGEPDKLMFQDPTGGDGFLSLQDIKNRAERGQLFFAVSIVANIALRSFSAWHSWSLADEAQTKAGPRYEFFPESGNGYRVTSSYQVFF